MSIVIIQGSSRSQGDTNKYVELLKTKSKAEFIDLSIYKIGQYDYDYKNKDDDFLPLVTDLIDKYETWVFATPLYWYSMSGYMKTFIDRFSDLIRIHKDTGRKIRTKKLAVLAESMEESDLPDYFFKPFQLTASYLGMSYLGQLHVWGDPDNISQEIDNSITEFSQLISGK